MIHVFFLLVCDQSNIWCLFTNIAAEYTAQVPSTVAEGISHLKLSDKPTETRQSLQNGNNNLLQFVDSSECLTLVCHLLSA